VQPGVQRCCWRWHRWPSLQLAGPVVARTPVSRRGSVSFAGRGEQQPSGAPRILYSSDRSGTSEIYAVDPSGRQPTGQLTFGQPAGCGPIGCGYRDASQSPDGSRLLMWEFADLSGRRPGCGFGERELAEAGGRRPRHLLPASGGGSSSAARKRLRPYLSARPNERSDRSRRAILSAATLRVSREQHASDRRRAGRLPHPGDENTGSVSRYVR
jgi:hypothetical protein